MAHPGRDVDPGGEFQRITLLVDEEIAIALDAQGSIGGVNAALCIGFWSEQSHHIIIPETTVRAENDHFGGLPDEMVAGHHR